MASVIRRARLALGALLLASACAAEAPTPLPPTSPPPKAPPPAAPTASAAPAASSTASAAPNASAARTPPRDTPPPPPEDELLPGFTALDSDGETRCGDFRVQFLKEPKGSYEHFVRVLDGTGKRVYEAHGRRYLLDTTAMTMHLSGEFCGDLTGDAIPEIVLTEATIGAHCCYTHYVVSLTSPPKRLLMWEKGDAGTPVLPARHRPQGPYQLVGSVVMWPPFDVDKGEPSISYAGAPLVPVVFALIGGEYQLASLSFPEVYRASRAAIHAECARAPNDCYGHIMAWIDSLAIGDWDQEKNDPLYDEFRDQLARPSAEMRATLQRSLGSEQRPVRTGPR
jgi:hypothetical protein